LGGPHGQAEAAHGRYVLLKEPRNPNSFLRRKEREGYAVAVGWVIWWEPMGIGGGKRWREGERGEWRGEEVEGGRGR